MEERISNINEKVKTEKELEALKEKYLEIEMPEEKVEALKKVLAKGKEENRKERRRRRRIRIMQSAAMIAVAFVLLPNTSASAAIAMERIPVLGNLVKVVTFRNYEYASERHQAEVDVAKLALEGMDETSLETSGQAETTEQVPPPGKRWSFKGKWKNGKTAFGRQYRRNQ